MPNPLVSEAARMMVAQRRTFVKQCVVCGREFTGLAFRKYDRNTCATVAYQRRKRAAAKQSRQGVPA